MKLNLCVKRYRRRREELKINHLLKTTKQNVCRQRRLNTFSMDWREVEQKTQHREKTKEIIIERR